MPRRWHLWFLQKQQQNNSYNTNFLWCFSKLTKYFYCCFEMQNLQKEWIRIEFCSLNFKNKSGELCNILHSSKKRKKEEPPTKKKKKQKMVFYSLLKDLTADRFTSVNQKFCYISLMWGKIGLLLPSSHWTRRYQASLISPDICRIHLIGSSERNFLSHHSTVINGTFIFRTTKDLLGSAKL